MSVGNLLGLLEQAAQNNPEKGVLVYHTSNASKFSFLTYKKLLVLAKQRSIQLRQLGDIDGKVVLMYFADHLDGIIWFWAIVAGGGVPCICPALSKDSHQRRDYITHLRELLEEPLVISTNSLATQFSGIEGLRVLSTSEIEAVKFEQPSHRFEFQKSSTPERDLAMLMLTSGSTGKPKAVCVKHEQIAASIKGKIIKFNSSHNDIFLNWVGLDHVANIIEIHLHAISLTAQQVHVPAAELLANPLSFLEYISNHKVTCTFAPNFFIAALVRCLESFGDLWTCKTDKPQIPQRNYDLASLRVLASGGEANVVDTCNKLTCMLEHFGAPKSFISPGFGMTETCAGSTHIANSPAYDIAHDAEFCSVGKAIPGMEIRISRPDGTNAGVDEIGSLEVSGPVVFSGYYNDTKASHAAFTRDGWFKTGDLGLLDSNGYLRLTGRDKDVVVINGVNHSCHGIEAAIELAGIPEITPSFTVVWPYRPKDSATEALCVAYLPVPSRNGGKILAMTATTISKVVIKYCGVRPFKIIALPKYLLQKNSLGKLPRSKIRQAFENGTYHEFEDEYTKSLEASRRNACKAAGTSTEKIILQVFRDLFAIDNGYDQLGIEVRLESDMFEIGVSSIDLLKLRASLQKALNVEIPATIFFSHPVLRDLSRAVDDLHKKVYDPVHLLQPKGTKTPLFLIHPGLGEILIFMNLARYIEDRPVYALRARGFDGEGFFSSMEEVITTYRDAIKRVQPTGPYAILGYSYGATLAFEITKVMEANNDKVQFLGSLDQPPDFKWWAKVADWTFTVLTIALYMGLTTEGYLERVVAELRKKTHDEVLDHIIEIAGPARLKDAGTSREHLNNWATLAYQLKVISREYDPMGQVANMDVFHIDYSTITSYSHDDEWHIEEILRWRDFARDCKTHVVSGRHATLIKSPNALSFSKKLKKAMEERGL